MFFGLQQLSHPERLLNFRPRRGFSILRRPVRAYDGHVPLTNTERVTLAIGASVMSLTNPRRGGNFIYADAAKLLTLGT